LSAATACGCCRSSRRRHVGEREIREHLSCKLKRDGKPLKFSG